MRVEKSSFRKDFWLILGLIVIFSSVVIFTLGNKLNKESEFYNELQKLPSLLELNQAISNEGARRLALHFSKNDLQYQEIKTIEELTDQAIEKFFSENAMFGEQSDGESLRTLQRHIDRFLVLRKAQAHCLDQKNCLKEINDLRLVQDWIHNDLTSRLEVFEVQAPISEPNVYGPMLLLDRLFRWRYFMHRTLIGIRTFQETNNDVLLPLIEESYYKAQAKQLIIDH